MSVFYPPAGLYTFGVALAEAIINSTTAKYHTHSLAFYHLLFTLFPRSTTGNFLPLGRVRLVSSSSFH